MRIGIISTNKEKFFEKYPALGEMIQVVDSGGWRESSLFPLRQETPDHQQNTEGCHRHLEPWSPGWLNVQIGLQTH